jgi:hypothetical protein
LPDDRSISAIRSRSLIIDIHTAGHISIAAWFGAVALATGIIIGGNLAGLRSCFNSLPGLVIGTAGQVWCAP